MLDRASGVTLTEVGAQAYAALKAVDLAREIRGGDRMLRHVYTVSLSQYVVGSLTRDARWFETGNDGGRNAAPVIRRTLERIKAFEQSGTHRSSRWIKLWEAPLDENKEAQKLAEEALEMPEEAGEEGARETFDHGPDEETSAGTPEDRPEKTPEKATDEAAAEPAVLGQLKRQDRPQLRRQTKRRPWWRLRPQRWKEERRLPLSRHPQRRTQRRARQRLCKAHRIQR
ncbi:hypothetical protein VTI74DRAFT_2340 [Chaetomium olivicolor]